MSNSGKSPWHHARRRFAKNLPAMFGLGWLIVCALVAIFAFLLMPDNTYNANFQVVELPKRPPGTEVVLLFQPSQVDAEEPGFWARNFTGVPDRFTPIPVQSRSSVQLEDGNVVAIGLRGEAIQFDLLEFMMPLDRYHPDALAWSEATGMPYELNNDSYRYRNLDGELESISQTVLESRFLEEQVVTETFLLGSDGFGRDVLSRLLLGTRVSLSVGLMAVLVSLVLGIGLGALAGFFRGWVDAVVMWFVSVVWSIPTLLLAISISFVLGEGFWQLFIAIGISMWVEVARIVRGQIFAVREMQYVEATRAMGFGNFRVILRHILPNILSPLLIVAAANFAAAILIEAGLSFLGVGVEAPTPSWGSMIKEGYTQVMFESGTWLAIFPGMAIVLVVISLNLVGFGLRDAFDPKYDH